MGKSPGKWIKGIFGKGSKSSQSKGRELSRSASEKPARGSSSKEPISTTTIVDRPLACTVSNGMENSCFGKGEVETLPNEGQASSLSNKKEEDKPSDIGANEPEKITIEQAAVIVQAFFRGYQARHEFQTLKSAVQLQAAVRGHLVRRQAVATLFCIQGIVRFQALTRGYMVRKASIGNGHRRKQIPLVKDASNQDSWEIKCSRAKTLFKNAFINELLASSQTSIPLGLDSNTAWSWLLRWSTSQVWAPKIKRNETGGSNSKLQIVETEQIKSKSNGRRAPSATVRNDPNIPSAESEKVKLVGRKLSSQSVGSSQEHPQFDKERVKHGAKKDQKSVNEVPNEETDVSKPKRNQRKQSKSTASISSERTSITPTGKSVEDSAQPEGSTVASQFTGQLTSEEHEKIFSNKRQDIFPLEKDCRISSGNYKSSKTTTLPFMHDDQDAILGSGSKVPSYMAKTASSKAKVKSQVSPRFEQDEAERNALTRRHSLPSSVAGKLISSPRVHKAVRSSGKKGNVINSSLSSSRDIADKGNLVDWKR